MKLTRHSYARFFAEMRRATNSLGLSSQDERDAYYTRVLHECANTTSIKLISSQKAFDACLSRFAADAGDYQLASHYDEERLKRTAYVLKVLCCQILQFYSAPISSARNYLEGIFSQAHIAPGFRSAGDSFYLDLTQDQLLLAIKIADSYVRKLKRKHFGNSLKLSFDDSNRFEIFGENASCRIAVPKDYYSRQPFHVLSK